MRATQIANYSLILLLCLSLYCCDHTAIDLPRPTDGNPFDEKIDEAGQKNKREAWLQLMHGNNQTDWRDQLYQQQQQKLVTFQQAIDFRSDCEENLIADGQVRGYWLERGASNQSGSVENITYDPSLDQIFLIAAGGSLWKGNREGTTWQVINEQIRLDPGILHFMKAYGQNRLFAFSGRIPQYSEDFGRTWNAATGVTYADAWGDFKDPIVLDSNDHLIYFLARSSFNAAIKLYKSSDFANSFEVIHTFSTSDLNNISLTKPQDSNAVFITVKNEENKGEIFQVDANDDSFQPVFVNKDLNFGDAPANLVGIKMEDFIRFYSYVESDEDGMILMKTDDLDGDWETQGMLPRKPWKVGLYISPSSPNVLYFGEVECYKSIDEGKHWEKINDWFTYYEAVETSLHADIMEIAEFETASGDPFTLIGSHGGISISDDYFSTQRNISLLGLHNAQYYSVRTDPVDPNYLYAGSQDQGLQLTNLGDVDGPLAFEQIIPGDYGHLAFSNYGQSLWAAYPDGFIVYYEDAQSGQFTSSYTLKSENETVWLPPLMESPNNAENAVYMAGGSIDGSEGSFLIKLTYESENIAVSQFEYDFMAASGGGTISAMTCSPLNPNKWYVATTNGRVFFSNDSGMTWEQSLNFLPEGHYLYGQTLHASNVEEETIYLGGTGYNNPGIYRSTDGGISFQAFANQLPSTLVLDLTGTPDESMLFAATEAGPFVFVVNENRWFDLSGYCSPSQVYWSAEFIPLINTVRFGTYGRGIWDFVFDRETNVEEIALLSEKIKVFPIPSQGEITIEINDLNAKWVHFQLTDLTGRVIKNQLVNDRSFSSYREVEDWSAFSKGIYFLSIKTENQQLTKKIMLH